LSVEGGTCSRNDGVKSKDFAETPDYLEKVQDGKKTRTPTWGKNLSGEEGLPSTKGGVKKGRPESKRIVKGFGRERKQGKVAKGGHGGGKIPGSNPESRGQKRAKLQMDPIKPAGERAEETKTGGAKPNFLPTKGPHTLTRGKKKNPQTKGPRSGERKKNRRKKGVKKPRRIFNGTKPTKPASPGEEEKSETKCPARENIRLSLEKFMEEKKADGKKVMRDNRRNGPKKKVWNGIRRRGGGKTG